VPWIVELFLSVEPGRYALIPHGFLFDTLGGEITDDEEENYRRLAVKLLRAVPAATRNIGARKLETCGETQFYPSRHAFDEELRWRFWRGKTAE